MAAAEPDTSMRIDQVESHHVPEAVAELGHRGSTASGLLISKTSAHQPVGHNLSVLDVETTGAAVPNAKKGKQAGRRERVAAVRAKQKRAERRRNLITIGAIAAVVAVIIGGVAWYAASRGGGSSSASGEVIPPGVNGTTTVQAAAHQVPNTSGIPGVVEYVTTGWPTTSHNGPAAQALAHDHVTGPVTYS